MAIEFRCTNCNRLLRVGDDTAGKRAKCPQCSTVLTIPAATAAADPAPEPEEGFVPPARSAASAATPAQGDSKRVVAGICAILVGTLGIHKFITGRTGAGVLMLILTLTCICSPIMYVIAVIEGIIYLTKSDAEFHQRYIVEKKGWF
jgi:TM2 domain-containing membrane protein YozV/phage FluMu protein Com